MNCCQCQGIEQVFSAKVAARELRAYRKKGPGKTTRLLIDALKARGVDGLTLLDIGGGVGKIQHELLDAGAEGAVSVDASSGYLQASQSEAERRGHSDRTQYTHGNFVELAPGIGEADIVTLDRVVCCYPDMTALVGLSAERARKYYGLVYPRDTVFARVGVAMLNLMVRFIWRTTFRGFVHPTEAVDSEVRRHGLKKVFFRKTIVWQVVLYAR
jgi:magnesium-protoporphyrin O-methyltransferase